MAETVDAGPAIREERRPITALFADLVGSTALAEALDEAEVMLIVGDAIAQIVTEVERLGGYVKDLAGDGVLAFFGAPVASEDDAERALIAALAIVESIDAYAADVERGWGIPGFGVRVGITTGPVVVGPLGTGTRVEYAAFGDTVNTAARLQAVAGEGAILVDEPTHRLTERLFDWGEPIEHALKGKELPVTAYLLIQARPGAEKPRGLAGIETPLVGREHELGRVEEALAGVAAGRGGLVLVTGEAGIGKSRLLLDARAGYDGLWFEGRCVSYGESLPYWPFRDLLREWLGAALDDPELRVRVALRRAVRELFGERELEVYPYLCSLLGLTAEPDAAARLADLSPEALQYRTFEVVEELLVQLARDRPLVVILDDLHWADTTSVQLVERLLAVGERAAVLLVIAQRDERDHASWRIRELAAREVPHLITEITLEPLSGNAQRELLEATVGVGTLPGDVEAKVLAAAEGNPFYLEELVRSLIDVGAIVRRNGGWSLDHAVEIEVPPTVERIVLARIDRLSPECHDVLTAASALGRRFGVPLLADVLDGNGDLDRALHELQRLDLVRATRRWPHQELRFKHALIQEAAYRTLLPERRQDLHRRAATWLERQYEGAEQEVLGLLARHWLEAGDEDKAVAYLARAGDQARSEWSLDEAIEHYRKLLLLLEQRGQGQEMAVVLLKLGLALHTALRFPEANAVFQRAFVLWAPPTAPETRDRVLSIATNRMPVQPDPPRSNTLPDIQLQMALFDRLVEGWPEATIVPWLAERWDVAEDGLRYVFHLREDLRWSDGMPLTAQDVEFGVKRNLDPNRTIEGVSLYFVLEGAQDYALGRTRDSSAIGVRTIDERTVEFRLVAPAPYFLSLVNRSDAGPQPHHAIEANGEEWLDPELQVVSGAFRQIERTPERVVLERRPGSLARPGNVGRVEIAAVGNDEIADAFNATSIDMVIPSALAVPTNADETSVELGPPAWTFYFAFDHGDPRLAGADVRLALAHALDREAVSSLLPPNLLSATGGIVPPALQGHTPDIVPRYDPDRARELLGRSGFDGELTLAGLSPTVLEPLWKAIARAWVDELGIDARYTPIPVQTWLETDQVSSLGSIVVVGWFPGYPDPEYFLRLLLHSESTDNVGHWSYPPFDDLIERARREPDGRSRLELFHSADRMAIAEQAAVIPIAYARNAVLVTPHVHGWWEYGKSWSNFADLVVSDRSPRAND